MKQVLYISLSLLLASCRYLSDEKTQQAGIPVARAFDKTLYASDLGELVPAGTPAKDSIEIVRGYINNWLQQNVILYHAEQNVTYDKAYIEQQLQNYRNSLIIFSYEQEIVRQKLDTAVTKQEIEEYYKKNADNFLLKKKIIKASYAKVPKSSSSLSVIVRLFPSTRQKDREKLDKLCTQNASLFSLADTSWFFFEQLTGVLPVTNAEEASLQRKNNLITFQDESYIYLVLIRDFKDRETPSPLEFEIDNIRNIIINKRKLALVSEIEKKLYQDAIKNGDMEVISEKK